MSGISTLPNASRRGSVRAVLGQLRNAEASLAQHIGADGGEVQRIITEAFLEWVVPQMAEDENPQASARELCRVILERVTVPKIPLRVSPHGEPLEPSSIRAMFRGIFSPERMDGEKALRP